jgi:uncharacterized protein (DUF2236 family)
MTPSTPDLLLWVHACLEQSSVLFYEETVGPLTLADKDRFHEENLLAAELVLLPRGRVPATFDATERYIDEIVASDRLVVTDVAREVADLIRGGPVPFHLKPVWRFIAFAAVGTLPPPVRELYGFRWGPIRHRVLGSIFRLLRLVRPMLPARIRLILPARIAMRRLRGEDAAMPRP